MKHLHQDTRGYSYEMLRQYLSWRQFYSTKSILAHCRSGVQGKAGNKRWHRTRGGLPCSQTNVLPKMTESYLSVLQDCFFPCHIITDLQHAGWPKRLDSIPKISLTLKHTILTDQKDEWASALLTVHSLIKQTPLPPFGKASGAVGACEEGLTVAVTILYHSKRSLGHYHPFPLP